MSSLAARLELLCEVNRRLATFTNLDDLLRFATTRARELFEAEGCSLLLLDEGRREFRFSAGSQRAGSRATDADLREIRFPATQGIAGWVLANGQAIAIDDVHADPRFYSGVDAVSGATTQSLLAAPLRTNAGAIGVIEVLNPRGITEGDLAFLEALGGDVAIAHERAALQAALRSEATGLRRLARLGGVALVALGLGLAGAAFVAHAARALPMGEILREPGMLLGLAVAGAGLVLAGAIRGVPTT